MLQAILYSNNHANRKASYEIEMVEFDSIRMNLQQILVGTLPNASNKLRTIKVDEQGLNHN